MDSWRDEVDEAWVQAWVAVLPEQIEREIIEMTEFLLRYSR